MSGAAFSDGGDDIALPIDICTDAPLTTPSHPEEIDMPGLSIGAAIRVPDLEGRWSVWSKSDETPGAYFVLPLDDAARDLGVKYAVIRARQEKGCGSPTLTVVRTDPTLATAKK